MKTLKYLLCLVVCVAAWQVDLLPLAASEAGSGAGASTNPMTFDVDLAIFTGIVFLLLLVVLRIFAWGPLMDGLDKREKSISDMIDDAKRSSEDAAAKLQQYEKQLQAATVEAQEIVSKAKRDATSAGEELLESARKQANRERQRAVEEIGLAKSEAIQEIASRSADIAFSLAGKVIQRELNPKEHAALIRETLKELPSDN